MKKVIKNPYSVKHRLYLILLIVFLILLIIPVLVSAAGCVLSIWLTEMIKNLAYGCMASTVVAWLIDCANIRTMNKKANNLYDVIYSDLKFRIAYYNDVWARLCVVVYKDKSYENEKHTWLDWYEIAKENFHNLELGRQNEILEFLREQILDAVKDARKSIQQIQSQRYLLAINELSNSKMDSILADFDFEFYALELVVSRKESSEVFWSHLDAIAKDMEKYISNWKDIRFYNCIQFKPYKFFDDKTELAKAILLSKCD